MSKLSRMEPERAAKKIAKEHLQNSDLEAVKALTGLIRMMRAIGGNEADWELAFKDAMALAKEEQRQ